MIISNRLWVTDRMYPLSPVWEWIPQPTRPWDWLLFVSVLLALAASAAFVRSWIPCAAALALIVLLALLDQTRWQPWAFQFICMLGLTTIFLARSQTPARAEQTLNHCSIIIAFMYFWSGLHKLNGIYADEGFPWILDPILQHLPPSVQSVVLAGALPSAILESLIGLGLLWRPARPLAAVLAIGMHLLILLCIGPLGRNWNPVIWPWNVVMMLQALILFWGRPHVRISDMLIPRRLGARIVVLLLFAGMPWLSFFDRWDTNLSASLYSGNIIRGLIYLNPNVAARLPDAVRQRTRKNQQGVDYIDLNEWAFDELKVPAYPARRVMRSIASRFCALADAPNEVALSIRSRPEWLGSTRSFEILNCADLAN